MSTFCTVYFQNALTPYKHWCAELQHPHATAFIHKDTLYINGSDELTLVYIPFDHLIYVYQDYSHMKMHAVVDIAIDESKQHVSITRVTCKAHAPYGNMDQIGTSNLLLTTFLNDTWTLSTLIKPFFGSYWTCSCGLVRYSSQFSSYIATEHEELPHVSIGQYTLAEQWYQYMTSNVLTVPYKVAERRIHASKGLYTCTYVSALGYVDTSIEDRAASVIAACFKGWRARMRYRFNPYTRLGKHLIMEAFDDLMSRQK